MGLLPTRCFFAQGSSVPPWAFLFATPPLDAACFEDSFRAWRRSGGDENPWVGDRWVRDRLGSALSSLCSDRASAASSVMDIFPAAVWSEVVHKKSALLFCHGHENRIKKCF